MAEIHIDNSDCKRRDEYFSQLDAMPWQEIVKLDDDALCERCRLTDDEPEALSSDAWDAMIARDDERLKRKYCGRLPEEIEEERDFDPSGEPAWFQEIWAIDLSMLTQEGLGRRREHKWVRGTEENPVDLPADVEVDGRGGASDHARLLWHRRVWAMTRDEFEAAYWNAKNPHNIAYYLIRDEEDRRETAMLGRDSYREDRDALIDEVNERIGKLHAMAPDMLGELIATLAAERDAAEAKRLAARQARAEAASTRVTAEPDAGIKKEKAKPAALPTFESLTHCEGVMGAIIDWVLSVSRRPNRTFALGVAITVIGTLIGRYVKGPTYSGSHLYVLMSAPTGAGKDDPLNCAAELLNAAACAQMVGQEFMSETALSNWLARQPLSLCPMDEFGMILGKMNSKKSNPHEKNVIKMLCTAWGRSFKMMKSAEKAGEQSKPIWWPALSILAATTPQTFFTALTAADLSSGFLNRILSLPETKREPKNKPQPCVVPSGLAIRMMTLHEQRASVFPVITNPVTLKQEEDRRKPTYEVRQREWAKDGAEDLYEAYDEEVLSRIDRKATDEWFIARNAETAVRLATIKAVGERGIIKANKVTVEDLEWGINIVRICSAEMVTKANANMTEEMMNYSELHNRVVNIIKGAGGEPIKRSDLTMKVKHRANKKQLDDVVDLLKEAEQIHEELVPPPAGGTRVQWYTWIGR